MKHRSSTFSFDTLKLEPRTLWRPGLMFALAGYIVLELTMRTMVPSGAGPSGAWRNVELREQALQLEAMGDIELIFTGSSIAAVNLPPVDFDTTLAEYGITLRSFNAGIRGCNYLCVEEGIEHVFLSRAEPQYVVLVVGAIDINEGNRYIIRRSESFIRTFQVRPFAQAMVNGASAVSWLYGFRAELSEWLRKQEWRHERSYIGEQGHIDLGSAPRERFPPRDITIDSEQQISRALIGTAKRLTSMGIEVVVIEGLGDTSLHAMLTGEARAALRALFARLDAIDGVRFIDVSDLRPTDDSFIDRVHLNSSAAKDYARAVAERFVREGFP